MQYRLYYTFDSTIDGQAVWVMNYEYDVEQCFDDILRYLYAKRFDREYLPLSWHLEPGAKDAVNAWEAMWERNEIKEMDYYTARNPDFLDWLHAAYYEDALQEYCDSSLSE